jgi:hypothetical protein
VNFPAELAGLVAFILVLLVVHEGAHVGVARAYGYPTVCLGFSPLAIGVVFLDRPTGRYWLLQVTVPLMLTAGVLYLGLFAFPLAPTLARVPLPGGLFGQMGLCLLLSAFTSSGDAASMATELHRPIVGRDRIVRDVRLLKKIGSLIRFTPFGRRYLVEEFGLSPEEFLRAVVRPSTTHPWRKRSGAQAASGGESP